MAAMSESPLPEDVRKLCTPNRRLSIVASVTDLSDLQLEHCQGLQWGSALFPMAAQKSTPVDCSLVRCLKTGFGEISFNDRLFGDPS